MSAKKKATAKPKAPAKTQSEPEIRLVRAIEPPTGAFDPKQCLVVVQTYPDGRAHTDIWGMLHVKQIPLANCRFVNMRDTIAARNFAVREHILPSGLSEALLIDADMMPGPRMDRLWRSKADIAGPRTHKIDFSMRHCILSQNADCSKTAKTGTFSHARMPGEAFVLHCAEFSVY